MADHDYKIPDDCHYTESDEWVRVDGATVRIGITDYAQSELNDIVFVELPERGAQLEEILDDAVVHHHHIACHADVRMRVALVGFAVGGPMGLAFGGIAGLIIGASSDIMARSDE